jgi:hypothetical protein
MTVGSVHEEQELDDWGAGLTAGPSESRRSDASGSGTLGTVRLNETYTVRPARQSQRQDLPEIEERNPEQEGPSDGDGISNGGQLDEEMSNWQRASLVRSKVYYSREIGDVSQFYTPASSWKTSKKSRKKSKGEYLEYLNLFACFVICFGI